MKYFLGILAILIFFLNISFNTCYQVNYELSQSEFRKHVKKAKDDNISALMQLYGYFLLHRDQNSTFMVECKGASIGNYYFKALLESRYKGIWSREHNITCPQSPLRYLKDHSSWIPIQIQIIWLCGKH